MARRAEGLAQLVLLAEVFQGYLQRKLRLCYRGRTMQRMWIWAVAAVVFLFACGDGDRPKLLPPDGNAASTGSPMTGGSKGFGGRGASAGSGGTGNLGGEAGDAGATSDPDGPLVRITSPSAVSHPDDAEVLLDTDVSVSCEVTRAGTDASQAIDPTKVKIVLVDPEGKETSKVAVSTGATGEFSATFPIAELDNGKLTFRCSAADVAKPARTALDEISTFVDRGPKITLVSPLPDSAHPLEGALRFEFMVEPAPLSDDDQGAALGEVTLTVDGVAILALEEDPTNPGLFSVPVDFADALLFVETPMNSVSVDIRAENRRTPTPAMRTESYVIVIDAEGPKITVASPKTGAIVGDQVQLNFSVTDATSGVDPSSVAVTLNQAEYVFRVNGEWVENKGAYTFTFDSTKISGSNSQATLIIRASDLAGNAAKGESLLLYLDNQPPVVLLDAPDIRMIKAVGNNVYCSESFDPLGAAAANDGQTIWNAKTFRSFVWDETNTAPGQGTDYHAQTNPASVRLYVQPNTAQPLLIDTDGDGYCDEIDVAGTTVLEMTALSTQGAASYSDNESERALAPAPPSICMFRNELPRPTPLCPSDHSDMNFVIRHTMAASPPEPVIYALDPQVGELDCTGRTWEIYSVVQREGWVCAAARAEDKVLNHGISRPHRVCLNDATDDEAGGTSTPCAQVPMPSCTDGCTPPPNEFPGGPILELK